MSERTIYRPGQPRERRKEWVSIEGGDLCVWAMTVAESTQILERSERPDGGSSKGMALVTQILLSCYDGEEPGSKRLFADHDRQCIYDLSFEDFELLMGAINRVNGKDATSQEALRDFTTVREEPKPSA